MKIKIPQISEIVTYTVPDDSNEEPEVDLGGSSDYVYEGDFRNNKYFK
jgi:hypothetical protein